MGPPMQLRIGMFGGGTVGGGVYELIEISKKALFKKMGMDVSIVKICVRDVKKARTFTVLEHTQVVDDFGAILDDESINCVIELMGGTTHAKDVVMKAVAKGKHVITANKALLAQYLEDLQAALKDKSEVQLGYEAAVCGGIPIIGLLQNDYLGDDISKVMGIMNGTTNFMLTKMEKGADYLEVLREAQALGFAEADPTADVEGHDVQAKIALLAKLAFGPNVPLTQVPCTGISAITAQDFTFAKSMNCTIKLTGTAMRVGDASSSKLAVFVSPVMVPLQHALATIKGPGNIVVVESRNLAVSSYAGPGAGRYPTANSVVNDVLKLARGTLSVPFPREEAWEFDSDFSACFYLRLELALTSGASRLGCYGILGRVGGLAEANGVSIHQILQNTPQLGGEDQHLLPEMSADGKFRLSFVVTTDSCQLSCIKALCKDLSGQEWLVKEPFFMPMLKVATA